MIETIILDSFLINLPAIILHDFIYTSQLLPNFVKDGCIAAAFVKILFYFLRLIPGKFNKNKEIRKYWSSSNCCPEFIFLSECAINFETKRILNILKCVSTLKLFWRDDLNNKIRTRITYLVPHGSNFSVVMHKSELGNGRK